MFWAILGSASVEFRHPAQFAVAVSEIDGPAALNLRDFMREREEAVEHEAWFRQVQIGLKSANAGNLIPAFDVEAKFAAKGAATRRRLETRKPAA